MTNEERQEIRAIVQREILTILDEADSHIIVDRGNDLGTIAKATVRHLAATVRGRAAETKHQHPARQQ